MAYENTAGRDEQQGSDPAAELRRRMEQIVGRLQGLADDQVTKKLTIEERWQTDLRQYHGRYDAETEKNLSDAKKSRQFVKKTRTKTHAWEARLSDMLFPTDDKNWGIKPTPVPELDGQAKEAARAAAALVAQANVKQQTGDAEGARMLAGQAQAKATEAQERQAVLDEAKRRAEAMESEIDDQLRESKYNIRCRESIQDATKLGTGIMKGPLVANRLRRHWRSQQAEGGPAHAMVETGDPRPEYRRIDPWNYFPDMDAINPDDREFEFERHLMTSSDLRKLARNPGFDPEAIRALLKTSPADPTPQYVSRLREITGQQVWDNLKGRYHVWEYYGALEPEDLRVLMEMHGDTETDTTDPLIERRVVVWFCQGHLLKFAPHPLDSNDSLYSIFNFEKDDASIFGFGVPYLMRDSQAALNGGWRMMMDNGALSVGPQIVVDRAMVEPADGVWEFAPKKIWYKKTAQGPRGVSPFEMHDVPNNQGELLNIITVANQFIDDETNLPLIAQGEPGSRNEKPAGTQTMGGMAMLMNSSNVVFRRIVKNFDDAMTTPNILRIYDWNMQFSPKEQIKGDMEIDARGSSVLLVRELQSQNLMVLLFQASGHPVLGPLTKTANAYRKLVQSMMLSADELVLTDDEIQRMLQEQEENAEVNPETIKLQIAQMNSQTDLEVAKLNHQTAMMTLAEQRNMSLDDLRSKLAIKQIETDSKERILATEVAVEERRAAREPKEGSSKGGGSGGYI